MRFPSDFQWGVASSSWQNEGCPLSGGGGLSTWDVMAREPGRIRENTPNEFGCDSVRQVAQDIELVRGLGPNTWYRFSFSWPRLMPEGTGRVNAAGRDYYDRLIDGLLAAGVNPFPALFWWDFPQALFLRGGWLNRSVADWFAAYVELVVRHYSDRVQQWVVYEEPNNFITAGLGNGTLAPGLRLPFPDVMRALHHALLAHGRGLQALRAQARTPPFVGWGVGLDGALPATATPADTEAARRQQFAVPAEATPAVGHSPAVWLDPICLGQYPAEFLAHHEEALPAGWAADMSTIHQPLDFVGANAYMGRLVRAGGNGHPENVPFAADHPMSTFRWPITPAAAYWIPRFLYERYRKPIFLTETGVSGADTVGTDGRVHDPHRSDFLARYLAEFARAGVDGVDIRGSFVWTLIDNFEWCAAYEPRFGLVYFDPQTRQRTPKDSYYWYRDFIARARAGSPTPGCNPAGSRGTGP